LEEIAADESQLIFVMINALHDMSEAGEEAKILWRGEYRLIPGSLSVG
jgi:hypothetical protein